VYSLVISTAIFPIYYSAIIDDGESSVVNFLGFNVEGHSLYPYTISFSFLTIALISPYLSAVADNTGNKKKFMKFFVWLGSLSCMSMFFFTREYFALGIVASYFASIGFSGSLVFYNAYLPEIAPIEKQDALSAKGFAIGYFGSSLLLILNLIMVQKFEIFGFENVGIATRTSFLMVGLWWLGFSQITFRKLPDNVFNKKVEKGYIKKSYEALISVSKQFYRTVSIRRFVLAFFFYSAGVQSVIFFATPFGKEVLELADSDLITTVLLIQFVGILGAWMFSKLSARFGNLRALLIAVVIWALVCFAAYLTQTAVQFYILGAFVGLVLGGIQALSRSTYSKMLPQTEAHATYFSFYDVGEKLATSLGTYCVGLVFGLTGDYRNTALVMTFFFVMGFIFLVSVPKNAIQHDEQRAQSQ
jgi:UMF1 family MFS transporter